jgi:nicotinamidase-related amidase
MAERSAPIGAKGTALLVIDPQNDFLSPGGSAWSLVARSVRRTGIARNLGLLFRAAKARNMPVVVSPHYFYPTDRQWGFNGPLEALEFRTRTFARAGPLTLAGLAGSGADWYGPLRPFIEDGKTVVASPHKVFGPQTNDVVLQLRKRGVHTVVLAGMLANMCVESHLRELLEQGFRVVVAEDAVAGPVHPRWGDGHAAAMTNFRFLAHQLLPTAKIVAALRRRP